MNEIATATTGQPVSAISVAQVKRVLEWWSSSQHFRDRVEEDPVACAAEYNLDFDLMPLRPLWDSELGIEMYNRGDAFHPAVLEYRAFYDSKTKWRDQIKEECSPQEERFRKWRLRQVARNTFENGAYDEYIIHTPMAIELTDGCTVGCWFCGVGATKFVDALPYAENKEDWRKTLHHLRDKTGTAGRWGFLYWATDPLDIPDYEDFANDFADVFGIFPQTTTAQAHLHLDRLRDLLPMSEARGCRVNRFSVLTEKSLKKIYEYFTPEEMLNVEIVSQMKDASVAKANTGDFRSLAAQREHVMEREKQKLKKTAKQIERTLEEDEDVSLVEPGTIACVSGFLLNMMSRTVKLISPCRASETWPLGYIVFDEMTFTDADDLNDKLTLLIDRHMTTEITADMRMQFHPGLDLHETEDGFILASKLHAIALERPAYRDYVKMLGKLIGSGDRTASQIALAGLYMHGVPEDNTLATLNHLFDNGALVDAHGRVAGQKGVIDQ